MFLLVMSVQVMTSVVAGCYHMSMLMMSACVNLVVVGCCHVSMLVTSAKVSDFDDINDTHVKPKN